MSTADQQDTVSRRANFSALFRVVDIPLLAVVALGIYFATAYVLVDRLRMMPMAHARMLNTKDLLAERGVAGHHDVYVLGSSVVVDGIDCDAMDEELPKGTVSFNIAGTGAGPGRWPVVKDRLAAAHPAAVVLVVDIPSAISDVPMPKHLSAVTGWFDFVPRDSKAMLSELLNAESEIGPLFASRYQQLLEFRVLPIVHFEVTVQETLRKDLRYEGYSTNFKAPWIRRAAVGPTAMDRSIQQMVKQLKGYRVSQLDKTLKVIRMVAGELTKEGCPVFVVLPPMNPAVARQLPPDYMPAMSAALAKGAKEAGAIYLDQTNLLPESGFSDHIHPFGEGRIRWSEAIGRAIRTALEKKRTNAVSDA